MITSPCAPSPDRYGALKQQPHITLALLLGHAADAPLLDHFWLTLRGWVGTGGGAKHIIYSTGILAIVEGRMAMVLQAMPPPQQPGRAEGTASLTLCICVSPSPGPTNGNRIHIEIV